MDWIRWAIVGIVVVGFLLLKRSAFISVSQAHAYLREGAKVIDVRSEQEYRERHIPGAVNIPLHSLRDEIAEHAPDKEKPLLLHCAGGVRSGMARKVLRQLGYAKAFNLGSFGRASSIVSSANSPPV